MPAPPLDLTVVIVNYNVQHFLAQCLRSVERAVVGLRAEVIVVDNNSVDGSVAMLRQDFPWVTLIANTDNPGFAKANNQALRIAKGRYCLLLNPDTVVEEDTFRQVVAFMDAHPEAGALGVRMVNGEGTFLPESKRALPTPAVAFYKMFGLTRLFPRSRRFGKYYMTYVPETQTAPVEVLSGAFMLLRKNVLDEVGLLDEDYFMYGEDIDLSYRITQAGYRNYYFAGTRIIHYKGESTKKGSLNYVTVFYRAMLIFVQKHFAKGRPSAFVGAIRAAIYLRAGLAMTRRLVGRALPVFLEYALNAAAMWALLEVRLRLGDKTLPEYYRPWAVWGYPALYVGAQLAYRNYRRPFRWRNLLQGLGLGFLSLVLVSWLAKPLNASRALVLASPAAAAGIALVFRGVWSWRRTGSFRFNRKTQLRMAIVGDAPEAARVTALLAKYGEADAVVGIVVPQRPAPANSLGALDQLPEILRYYRLNELVFCNASLPTAVLIETMVRLKGSGVAFKIVPPGAEYLVGPQTVLGAATTAG